MNALILILSAVLPLLPLVMFPTRFIGRGIGQTMLGAALLVGVMMLLYFGMAGLSGDGGAPDPALPSISDADIAALEKLLK